MACFELEIDRFGLKPQGLLAATGVDLDPEEGCQWYTVYARNGHDPHQTELDYFRDHFCKQPRVNNVDINPNGWRGPEYSFFVQLTLPEANHLEILKDRQELDPDFTPDPSIYLS